MSIKETVRTLLRRHPGVEVSGYRHTVPARRQSMLDHFGVEMLVDVGANVGQYAQEARRGGYRHHILSLEPVSVAFERLASAADTDPRWDARKTAVGSQAGTLTMHVSEGSIFSSPLAVLDSTTVASPNARAVRDEEVPVTTLDDLLAGTTAPLAVKIDVQGFERDVLAGGSQTLQRARLIELELSPRPVYDGQMLMVETLERMADEGFVLSLTENLFPEWPSGRALQFNGIFTRADDS